MKLTNTSRYPTDEVALLVEFAMGEIDHTRLAVNVKNASIAYRGRAYDGVPRISSRANDPDIERLVTIGIGSPQHFPMTTVHTEVRWVRVTKPIPTLNETFRERRDKDGHIVLERRVISQHGYGGKRSPVLEFANWREALVSVAAHEGRHIWQYQAKVRKGEVDAEQFAGRRLEEFRQLGKPSRGHIGALQMPLAL